MTEQQEGEELDRLREGFRVARLTGLWRSPYPQSQWSALLGVMIRESLRADPALTVTSRSPARPSVHGVGSALPSACIVWHR